MSLFKDHFSGHAALYSTYRPDYPAELYQFLADQSPSQQLVWDCATGSGQAALGLAEHFELVIATDASAEQIENAVSAENISYRVACAEQSGLADNSVDLITVAQALHWFDLNAFYTEVDRVLKPNGVLAIWSYNLLDAGDDITPLLNHLYHDIVGPYWPKERRHIEQGYRELPFPYTEQTAPQFAMSARWTLKQLTGYLRTWSAVQRYNKEHGSDALQLIEADLASKWGDENKAHTIRWPLSLRWGRKT